MPDKSFSYKAVDASGMPLKAIPYKKLNLNLPWQSFDIAHELTTAGIQRFVADYRSTLRRSAYSAVRVDTKQIVSNPGISAMSCACFAARMKGEPKPGHATNT